MATGMVLSVAQTLFAALQCQELRDLCSMFGYESQLDELQDTATTIKAVLLDAESKQQELTHEGRNWVESLKDAVYDVDDLLDEFRTIALQQQQMRRAKVSKKVRRFFSRYNKLYVAFNVKHEIKVIKDKLDNIAMNRSKFGFGDTYEPVKRRDETHSYVREESIIGRENDRDVVVDMLLSENKESISFVTVVGIGGLGKTALAQLVFNDDRIKSAFDLRLWVCVSDDFSMERIFSQMVEEDGLKIEVLQRKVRQKIEGKKYLLVLDDIWNENRNEWFALRDFLVSGGQGSRVLVTSRSQQVARVIENNSMHELKGLTDDNSWSLFQRMAFEHGKEPAHELVEIGKEIVKRCVNVPLSIRVIGSLLYGQERSKWLSFKSVDLSKLGEDKEGILPILKFSYYHLTPSLKSCFSYCALFPKDFIIYKQFLINLWMAQGCLDGGLQDGRSIEDVGEENFSILLQRCFLQDVKKNVCNEIYSCKMHDLIHDLAQEVAGKEFSLVNTIPINRKTRHVSINGRSLVLFTQNESLDKMKNLRTIHLSSYEIRRGLEVTKILAHGRRLRVLKLHGLSIKSIPNTLSSLIHLRYLDLSHSIIEMLPKSITKLLNLKVLDLFFCPNLKELPKDLGKLVNLRQLDIEMCWSLTHMPAGLDNLTCLNTLTMFVLGEGSSNQVQMGQLQELKHLLQLRGALTIIVREGYSYDATNAEGGYLVNKSQLKALTIQCQQEAWARAPTKVIIEEELLEGLKPHSNVERLYIGGYKDMKLPNWAATLGSSLPLLVSLSLDRFPRLQHLPLLSQLQHLKRLVLSGMDSVEYIENDNNRVPFTQGSRTANVTFFQSLETLDMDSLPKLKGWWKDDISCSLLDRSGQDVMPSFPRLHDLKIRNCPHMTYFPRCPHLKKVELINVDKLNICKKREATSGSQENCYGVASSSDSIPVVSSTIGLDSIDIDNNNQWCGYTMDELKISNIEMLNSLIEESLCVSTLDIYMCNIERLSDARIEHLTNDLQHLGIIRCENVVLEEEADEMMPWKALHTLPSLILASLPKMVKLPKGLQYLTSLHTLRISFCKKLELEEEGDGMMPWKALHSLTRLELFELTKLVNLPKGIQCLTSLQYLQILHCKSLEALPERLDSLISLQYLLLHDCQNIKSLPEAISRLPSLTQLEISWCDDSLLKRCTEPDGEDCPKIRHIPRFHIDKFWD